MVSTCEGSCASFWPPVPVAGVAGSGGASATSIGGSLPPEGSPQLTHPENPLLVLDSAGTAVVDSRSAGQRRTLWVLIRSHDTKRTAAEEGAVRFG